MPWVTVYAAGIASLRSNSKAILRAAGLEVHRRAEGERGLTFDLECARLHVRRRPVRRQDEVALNLEYVTGKLAALKPRHQFTVLQVGAFDGSANDPVESSIRALGWRAVLVEPQPAPFSVLQTRYEGNPAVQVFNVAIGDIDGTRPFYMLSPTEDLGWWASQIASFDRNHLESFQKWAPGVDFSERITEIDVPTWTFETLLDRSHTDRVDVLQIDAEGYDFELLRAFDVPKRQPLVIQYEHKHLSKADRDAALAILVDCGYRIAVTHNHDDTLAVLGD